MLEAYSTKQTLLADGFIPFTSVTVEKGNTAILSGQNSIQLNNCGVYEVNISVSGLPAAAGVASITMTRDGVPQPQANVNNPSVLTNVGVNMDITTLVQVPKNNSCHCCSIPTTLQFVVDGVGLTSADAHLVVTRVC